MDDVITVPLKDKSEKERGASPWKGGDDWEQERVDTSLNSRLNCDPKTLLMRYRATRLYKNYLLYLTFFSVY